MFKICCNLIRYIFDYFIPLCKYSSRCMACTHIYYGDRPAVLHGRLVIIHNYHIIEISIDPYSDLD